MAKNILKLEDVYFAYVIIDKPQKDKFDATGLTKKFSATVFLSKAQSKEFKARKLNKTVKEIDTSDFEAKYKFAPPYPEQEEQYYIQVSKTATYKDGNLKQEWTFPKAYFKKEDAIVESTSTAIGNGSFGDIRLELSFNEKNNATSIILDSVLIKNHVPYESKGDEWASAAGIPSYVPPKETRPQPAVTQQSADLDDDLPF